jgi:diaminopropionate ammonia-lyase
MSVQNSTRFQLFVNPDVSRTAPYDADGRADILSDQAFEIARREIASWPGYRETIAQLPGLARALNIGQVFYKDEGGRFGLGIALLFGTEVATDPDVYRQIVGRSADDVRATAVA